MWFSIGELTMLRWISVLVLLLSASRAVSANQCVLEARAELKAAKQTAVAAFKAAKVDCNGSGAGNLPADTCGNHESDKACCVRLCCPGGTAICIGQAPEFCPRCTGGGICPEAAQCP